MEGNGETPFHLAGQKGHVEIARMLLEREAPIDSKTTDSGVTPLHLASQNGHLGIMALLLQESMRLESQINGGQFTITRSR